jgi:hypothetical protein
MHTEYQRPVTLTAAALMPASPEEAEGRGPKPNGVPGERACPIRLRQ